MLIKRGNPASRIEACCAQLLRMQTVEIRRRFRRSSCRLQSKNIWSMASGPDENVREKGGAERERERGFSMDSRIKSAWPNPRHLPTPRIYLANYFYLRGLLVRIQGQWDQPAVQTGTAGNLWSSLFHLFLFFLCFYISLFSFPSSCLSWTFLFSPIAFFLPFSSLP